MDNLKDELNIYRTVASMSGDTLYRYDIAGDEMELFFGQASMSKYGSHISNYVSMLKNTGMLGQTDADTAEKLILTLLTGEPGYFEYEVQLNSHTGVFHWYLITGKTMYDDMNKPSYVVGKMTNIDEHHMSITSELSDEYMDPLTGVLSKAFFKKKLSEKCGEMNGAEGALAVISIDDFKKICELNEYVSADNIVLNVSQSIKRIFSYNVAIGRTKQDEFTICYFGENVRNEFVPKLEELKNNIYALKIAGLANGRITISGGIFFGPFKKGDEYDIRDKARMALVSAQYRGKDCFVMYSRELEEAYNVYNSDLGLDESYDNINFDHHLVEKALDIMSSTGNVEEAVNSILKRIGKKYKLDRIYVQELNYEEKTVNVTYSWIRDTHPYLAARLAGEKQMDYEWVRNRYFDKDIIIINDIDELKKDPVLFSRAKAVGVKSIVQCVFSGNLICGGCMGFETYGDRHVWSETEIKTFRLMTKLVSTFLLNVRSYEELLLEDKSHATHDVLTGYYKLDTFVAEADRYIRHHSDEKLALIYTGMKYFSRINDIYGYEAGDEILKAYGEELKRGEERFIMGCRVNADNFLTLMHEFDSRGVRVNESAVDRLNARFGERFAARYPEVNITVNAGIIYISGEAVPMKKSIERVISARETALADDRITCVIE